MPPAVSSVWQAQTNGGSHGNACSYKARSRTVDCVFAVLPYDVEKHIHVQMKAPAGTYQHTATVWATDPEALADDPIVATHTHVGYYSVLLASLCQKLTFTLLYLAVTRSLCFVKSIQHCIECLLHVLFVLLLAACDHSRRMTA